MHTRTTAEEILAAFEGRGPDYFVTGFGTGGTIKGTSRVLREKSPHTRIILCEPDNSQLLGSGIPQERNPDGSPAASHPVFRPHLMQGWSPDFIPKLTEDAVNAGVIDAIIPVDGNAALRYARELARQEGIFSGTSGGATFAGAIEVAGSAAPGANILCMLPDTGERYLSTPLFEDIAEEMTEEELEISRSTPNFRFDAPTCPPTGQPKQPEPEPEIDAEAAAFVAKVIADAEKPVVLFALEWCEFCWSVRKLFARLGIPYRAVDLDSVEYQKDGLGGKIRAVLNRETGSPTIPQIYMGGDHIGGATDLFKAYEEGHIKELLAAHGIELQEMPEDFEPASLLPGWLHRR